MYLFDWCENNSCQIGSLFSLTIQSLIKNRNVDSCHVEFGDGRNQTYQIIVTLGESGESKVFGSLSFERTESRNNVYSIIIGRKFYQTTTEDLRDRLLAIVDVIGNNLSGRNNGRADTILQVGDHFLKTTGTYHLSVVDFEMEIGYVALVILLDLHERKLHR